MQSTDTIAYHPLWQVDVYKHGIGLWFYVCGIVLHRSTIWNIWEFQSKKHRWSVSASMSFVSSRFFLNINSYQLDFEIVVEPYSVSYPNA